MPWPPFLSPSRELGGQCTINGADAGGPRKVVPSLALRWSHATGATHATTSRWSHATGGRHRFVMSSVTSRGQNRVMCRASRIESSGFWSVSGTAHRGRGKGVFEDATPRRVRRDLLGTGRAVCRRGDLSLDLAGRVPSRRSVTPAGLLAPASGHSESGRAAPPGPAWWAGGVSGTRPESMHRAFTAPASRAGCSCCSGTRCPGHTRPSPRRAADSWRRRRPRGCDSCRRRSPGS
jgi:hypothetical protein